MRIDETQDFARDAVNYLHIRSEFTIWYLTSRTHHLLITTAPHLTPGRSSTPHDVPLVFNLSSLLSLLDVAADNNILHSLVGELKILLHGDVIPDLEPDDWGTNQERATKQAPGAAEHDVELGLEAVQAPVDGSTGRLKALVETNVEGRTTAAVGEGPHVPVHAGLEDGIEESVEEVQEQRANVTIISPVDLERIPIILKSPGTGDLLFLPGPATAPDNESEDDEAGV